MKQRSLLIFTTTAILIFAAVAAYIILSNPNKNMDNNNNNNNFSSNNNTTNTPTVTPAPETAAANTKIDKSATPVASKTYPDGLMVDDLTIGNGAEAKAGDTITVNYIGELQDGTVFDSSYTRGEPISFPIGVGSVIPGWDEGVPGMKVGGKRILTIPASLGYGASGVEGVIPANATLIFQVELVDVTPGTAQ